MNYLKHVFTITCMAFVVACLQMSAAGQSAENKLASLSASGQSVRFDVAAPNAGITITIAAPDGQVLTKEIKSGSVAEFRLVDRKGERLPDGQYTYELRVAPVLSADVKEALAAAREKGNSDDVVRDLRKRGVLPSQGLVQSGGFAVLNGLVVVPGASEEGGPRRAANVLPQPRTFRPNTGTAMSGFRRNHAALNPFFDFVIADDLIVQGSACVGLDCADGENFGFDTIRVKENNTRIQFDDTSTSAGFATNNWQIRANSSASGGGSFLGFVDQGSTGNSETGTIVFEADAGAAANSLRVSSNSKVGNKTATPVLDFHTNSSDTPAIRLEQNNSGGFTAQTWDIGANEANFFVRDVTSGSRLPFRIRPGAPTSSIDINASGSVGIGTASPSGKVHIFGGVDAGSTNSLLLSSADGTTAEYGFFSANQASDYLRFGYWTGANFGNVFVDVGSVGRVGIGTSSPDQMLSVNGGASKVGGGSWSVFSDERLKKIKGNFTSGLKAVMQLQPVRFEYLPKNPLGLNGKGEYVGFGAQSLQKVIPEAVSETSSGYLMVNNDPIIWTMLNAIKEQQQEIVNLKKEVRQLRRTSRRRR